MSTRAASPYTWRSSKWREFYFWLRFLIATFTRQSLLALSKARLGETLQIQGLANLPAQGGFVLTANHNKQVNSLDQLACCIQALHRAQPELADRLLIIVGQRLQSASTNSATNHGRALSRNILARWSDNVLRVALDANSAHSLNGLRAWRKRATEQPCFVFPEGKVNNSFQDMRPGTGRWLKSFNVPIIPTAIWAEHGQWHIRFGESINWSEKAGLEDLQLGLAIADLLPPPLAPDWQILLRRWRDIHSQKLP